MQQSTQVKLYIWVQHAKTNRIQTCSEYVTSYAWPGCINKSQTICSIISCQQSTKYESNNYTSGGWNRKQSGYKRAAVVPGCNKVSNSTARRTSVMMNVIQIRMISQCGMVSSIILLIFGAWYTVNLYSVKGRPIIFLAWCFSNNLVIFR